MPTIRNTDSATTTDAAGRKVFEGHIKTDASVHDVWDLMADTQRLNEVVFEMGAMEVVGRGDGQVRMKTKIGPLSVEFDELAWTFDAPRRYRSVRAFHAGPLKRLEAECEIDPDDGGSLMTYRVRLTTAGIAGFAADAWVMGQVKQGFARLAPLIAKTATTSTDVSLAFPPSDHAQTSTRAAPFAAATEALDPSAAGRVARLVTFIARANDSDVARLRPYELARRMNDDRDAMLATFLRATKTGLVTMRWDVLCPSCTFPVGQITDLQAAHKSLECPSCLISFATRPNSNVEAAFSPDPSIREASTALFCLGSPRRTAHWISQLTLAPGETRTLKPRLSAGRYRVQATGLQMQTLIDVGATGAESGRVILEMLPGRGPVLPDATVPLRAGDLTLELRNDDTKPHVFQLVHDRFADDAATATHVIALPLYRELFG